jgi:hypothetical protein
VKDKPRLRDRLPYAVAVAALVPAIWQAWTDGQLFLAGLSAVLLLVNLAALLWQKRFRLLLPVAVHLLNGAVALFVARQMTLQGKHWIQYAWLGAGVVYLFVGTVVLPRKHRRRDRLGGGAPESAHDP